MTRNNPSPTIFSLILALDSSRNLFMVHDFLVQETIVRSFNKN